MSARLCLALGRVIDGGLARIRPDETPDLAADGMWVYAEGVDPDAVEVRTRIRLARPSTTCDVTERPQPCRAGD